MDILKAALPIAPTELDGDHPPILLTMLPKLSELSRARRAGDEKELIEEMED